MADKKAVLILSDGSVHFGQGIGALTTKSGELVFNTSMTGYQEALSDPSYAGQILLMTYPLIGNYGFNEEWQESQEIWPEAFCVKTSEVSPHHEKNSTNLDKFLEHKGVPGICNLDTRKLVRKIRNYGVLPAAIQVYEQEPDLNYLQDLAKNTDYSNLDFVPKASIKEPKTVGNGKHKIALLDFGVKGNIVRELLKRDCTVTIYPYDTKAEQIISSSPDGIFISNGPGDPARLQPQIAEIKKLLNFPIMGICLGHQLLGWVAGSKTYKLKFGHRGSNHPVLDKELNKVLITTQNHGFAVDEKGISKDWEITHINLNDNTCEGLAHKTLPIFSVQYHPEAHPGPRDSLYLFDKFVKML